MLNALARGRVTKSAKIAKKHTWRSWGALKKPIVGADPSSLGGAELRSAFSDLEITPNRIVSAGDRVLVEARLTGKHTGDYGGVPKSGMSVSADIFYLGHLKGGEIVDSVAYLGDDQLLRQLRGTKVTFAPTLPLETHTEPTKAPLAPDAFQELHRAAAFAVAARISGNPVEDAFARGEMKVADLNRRTVNVKDIAAAHKLTVGIREIFSSGPYTVARFLLKGRRARGLPKFEVDVLVVAKSDAGKVTSVRSYFDDRQVGR